MSFIRVFWLLFTVQFLVSCSTDRKGLPAPTGVTASLPRNSGTTRYWVDEVADTKNPSERSSVPVSGTGEFKVAGWAVDAPAQSVAGGVDIIIDNTPIAAAYGIARQDVADASKTPSYRDSGFQFSMPSSRLRKGTHTFAVRIVSSDRKSYYEVSPLSLTVP